MSPKLPVAGFAGLGLKTRAELPRKRGWHVAESWRLRRGDGNSWQEAGPSIQNDKDIFRSFDCNA